MTKTVCIQILCITNNILESENNKLTILIFIERAFDTQVNTILINMDDSCMMNIHKHWNLKRINMLQLT